MLLNFRLITHTRQGGQNFALGQLYHKHFRYSKCSSINIVLCLNNVAAIAKLLYSLVDTGWWKDFRVRVAVISPDFIPARPVVGSPKKAPAASGKAIGYSEMEWIRATCKIWVPNQLQRGALMLRDGLLPAVSAGILGSLFSQMVVELRVTVLTHFGDLGDENTAESSVSEGGSDDSDSSAP